ncbi:GFA family protein [Pseudoalteromonas xiamenensis]
MNGGCHCGNVTLVLKQKIELVTRCNCSVCYRYGAVWAYFSPKDVFIDSKVETRTYCYGDKHIDFHHCVVCGCLTHYTPTAIGNVDRMAVNLTMFAPEVMEQVHVRYFDGAKSWTFYEK